MHTKFLSENLRGGDRLEDIDVDGRTISIKNVTEILVQC